MNHQLKKSPTMSPKSFVKDVVKCFEPVTPKSGRADATGPSRSNTGTYVIQGPMLLNYVNVYIPELK